MNSLTPTERDRGLQRLRRLTFGATAGALVAVVGVSYAAAASYAGKTTSSSTALKTTTTDSSTTSSSDSSQSSSTSSVPAATAAPTIGQAVRLAGYDDDFTQIAATGGPITLRAWRVPGWQAIRLDRRTRTVFLPPGVELDLGSTGKALAADLAATAAHKAAGHGVL